MTLLYNKRVLFSILLTFFLIQMAVARRIAVLLPFGTSGAVGQTMVEFYRGFLMAADSVRTEGMSIDIYALDCGTTVSDMEKVLARDEISQMDCIVGPGIAVQAPVLANFCDKWGIQLLMPFNTPLADTHNKPTVFQNVAPQEVTYAGVIQLMMENFADANFILLQTDESNARGIALQHQLKSRLQEYGIPFTTLNVNGNINSAEQVFALSQRNIILTDSPTESALKKTISLLQNFKSQNPNYRISFVGFPDWFGLGNRYTSQLHALDTYIFSTFYNNGLSGHSVRFVQAYRRNFNQAPLSVTPSLAMLGFDMGVFSMQSTRVHPMQHGFTFRQDDTNSAFVNHFVQLVHLEPNNMVTFVK